MAIIKKTNGTPLVVHRPRLCSPNVGGPGVIPGQGTRPHMLQLRPGTAKYVNNNNNFKEDHK